MGRFFSRFQDLSADKLLALLNTEYMLFLFELLRNALIPDWDQKKEVRVQ
jgi:hypothetical protein